MSGYQGYGLVWLGRWDTRTVAPGEVHFVCEVSIDPHAHDHHQVFYSYLTSWDFNGRRIGDLSVASRNYPPWQNKVGAIKIAGVDARDWFRGYQDMTSDEIQNAIVTRARDPTINDRTAFTLPTLSPNLFTTDKPIRTRQRKPGHHDGTVDAVVLFSHETPAGIDPMDHWNLTACPYWEVYRLPENGGLAAVKDLIRVLPKLEEGLSLESYLTSAGKSWGIRINVLPQVDGSTTMYSWDDCPELQLHDFMSRKGGKQLYIEVVVYELDEATSPVNTEGEDEQEESEEESKRRRTRSTRGVAAKVAKSVKKTGAKQKSIAVKKSGAKQKSTAVKKTGAKKKSTPVRNTDGTFRKSAAGSSKTGQQKKRGRASTWEA